MGFFSDPFERPLSRLKASNFHVYAFSLGCCDSELEAVRSATYDWSRLGVVEVSDATQADVLLVSGWINSEVRMQLLEVYRQMKGPRYVLAVGACAISGTPYSDGKVRPIIVSDFLPVDVYLPGCPPSPEMLIDGINALKRRIHPDRSQREILQEAMKTGRTDGL